MQNLKISDFRPTEPAKFSPKVSPKLTARVLAASEHLSATKVPAAGVESKPIRQRFAEFRANTKFKLGQKLGTSGGTIIMVGAIVLSAILITIGGSVAGTALTESSETLLMTDVDALGRQFFALREQYFSQQDAIRVYLDAWSEK